MKKKLIKRSVKLYPFYAALSGDLLFYYAINTIFMTAVKGLSPAQFISLGTIGTIVAIICRLPLLKVVKKLGNLNSMRLGNVLLLVSALLITFLNSYVGFIIAWGIYSICWTFNDMGTITLKNNLRYLKKEHKLPKILSRSTMYYSMITMVIALGIGFIFGINEYLPMYLCIFFCVVNIIFVMFLKDAGGSEDCEKIQTKFKLHKSKFLRLFLLVNILIFGLLSIGVDNGRLFIQDMLSKEFDIKTIVFYLGVIVFISRIIRVISNAIFDTIYKKWNKYLSIALVYTLFLSFGVMIIGAVLDISIYYKLIIMALGYVFIIGVRDPLKHYTTLLILKNMKEEHHQESLSFLSMSRDIGRVLIGAGVSLSLINHSLLFSIIIMFLITYIASLVVFKSLKYIKKY